MIIFGGTSSSKLARHVSVLHGAELGILESRRFPDGELYLRILSEVKNKPCAVIQSTPSDDAFVELIFLLDALNDLGASEVHAVVPYLGYSRQDKVFKSGEAFSAKTVLRLLDQFADSVTTVNCHFLDFAGVFDFAGVKLRNLDAFPNLAAYFRDKIKSPVIVSPDDGALEYAKKAAGIIGCEFFCLKKERLSDRSVKVSADGVDVKEKDAIILDDMISTGGTIVEAARFLKAAGARSVSAGCVHGVFSNGLSVFKGVVDEVVCSDTLASEASKVSVADLVSEALK